MGNSCCCLHRSTEVSHSDSEDILDDKTTSIDGETTCQSTCQRTDYWSRFLSDGSINVSLFSSHTDVPTDYKCISEFCVDDPMDHKPCHVTGMTSLPDGSIVMIDSNNKKIKVFSPEFEFAFVQNTRSGIRDVEYIGEYEIAVTEGKSVCFYKIENRYITKRVKKFLFWERVGCISYNGYWYAVQCLGNGHLHIKVLDTEGSEKFDIQITSVMTSSTRFSTSIALDNREDIVYVTDTKSKCVKCIDFNGNVLWETPSNGFQIPRSLVALDHVLVCADWAKNRVLRISPDGSTLTDVIAKGLRKPSFLAFQLLQNRLIVYSNSRRFVQIFQIQVIQKQVQSNRSVHSRETKSNSSKECSTDMQLDKIPEIS